MRKRKKTAMQVAQHLGRADTHPPNRDCAVRPCMPSPPLKPQTKPQHLLPTQLELLLAWPKPSVPAWESPSSLPSGLVAMPWIPSRRMNTSNPELALLHPQTGGWSGQEGGKALRGRAPGGEGGGNPPSSKGNPLLVWQQPPAHRLPSSPQLLLAGTPEINNP